MVMIATVLRVSPQNLLVRDISNNMEVLVNFRGSSRFNVGDRVRITYNGAMTRSQPPQITATNIQRISAPPVTVTPILPNLPNQPNRPGQGGNFPNQPNRLGQGQGRPPVQQRPPFAPNRPISTVTAIILQIGRNSLVVWNLRENRLMQVENVDTRGLAAGQLVTIAYNTMTFTNPPRITALSVNPA